MTDSMVQAIIYVVDSSDTERIGTSAAEFHAILEEEELKDALILVYANKQVPSPPLILSSKFHNRYSRVVYLASSRFHHPSYPIPPAHPSFLVWRCIRLWADLTN